ncbi:MAG: nuclear transport factor 2 family protein [Saprospiraceae bacterium]|nr:nuclear transport factor 2 family protein [Saprospiraceae bacterium]
MKTHLKVAASIILVISSLNRICADSAKPGSVIENIKWLLGTWETRTSNGSVYETWILQDPNELSGKSYAIKGTDTLIFETVRLIEKNGKILYIPSVTGQNNGDAVVFESSFISPSKFIVQNPEHDFPQVISYTRIGQDQLVAEISGPSGNGQVNYQTFSMKRSSDVMSRNINLIQEVFRLFNEHNWEQMARLYADPAEFKDPTFGIQSVMQSHDEIIRKYQEMNKMSPDIHDEVLTIYPSDEKHVVVEFISSGTAPDGSKWKLPIVTIFSIEHNLIIKDFTYYDR